MRTLNKRKHIAFNENFNQNQNLRFKAGYIIFHYRNCFRKNLYLKNFLIVSTKHPCYKRYQQCDTAHHHLCRLSLPSFPSLCDYVFQAYYISDFENSSIIARVPRAQSGNYTRYFLSKKRATADSCADQRRLVSRHPNTEIETDEKDFPPIWHRPEVLRYLSAPT